MKSFGIIHMIPAKADISTDSENTCVDAIMDQLGLLTLNNVNGHIIIDRIFIKCLYKCKILFI